MKSSPWQACSGWPPAPSCPAPSRCPFVISRRDKPVGQGQPTATGVAPSKGQLPTCICHLCVAARWAPGARLCAVCGAGWGGAVGRELGQQRRLRFWDPTVQGGVGVVPRSASGYLGVLAEMGRRHCLACPSQGSWVPQDRSLHPGTHSIPGGGAGVPRPSSGVRRDPGGKAFGQGIRVRWGSLAEVGW